MLKGKFESDSRVLLKKTEEMREKLLSVPASGLTPADLAYLAPNPLDVSLISHPGMIKSLEYLEGLVYCYRELHPP